MISLNKIFILFSFYLLAYYLLLVPMQKFGNEAHEENNNLKLPQHELKVLMKEKSLDLKDIKDKTCLRVIKVKEKEMLERKNNEFKKIKKTRISEKFVYVNYSSKGTVKGLTLDTPIFQPWQYSDINKEVLLKMDCPLIDRQKLATAYYEIFNNPKLKNSLMNSNQSD